MKVYFRLDAEDRDLGAGGDVHFEFDSSVGDPVRQVFRLDKSIGVLSAAAPLDREICDRYAFSVRAVDEAGKYSTGKLNSLHLCFLKEPLFLLWLYWKVFCL